MQPPPPRSPPFPYTTLFRSARLSRDRSNDGRSFTVAPRDGEPPSRSHRLSPRRDATQCPGRAPRRTKCHRQSVLADRKSTRLNSSHLVTSYAVFCLKKKIQL